VADLQRKSRVGDSILDHFVRRPGLGCYWPSTVTRPGRLPIASTRPFELVAKASTASKIDFGIIAANIARFGEGETVIMRREGGWIRVYRARHLCPLGACA
jgi:hypothetical protein